MDDHEARLKRLRMRSWRRGTREMDLILGPFADTQTEGMSTGWLLLLLSELFAPVPRAYRAGLWGAALVLGSPYQAHAIGVLVAGVWLVRRLPWRAAAPALLAAAAAGALLLATESRPGGALQVREEQLAFATVPPRSSPLGVSAPPGVFWSLSGLWKPRMLFAQSHTIQVSP